MTNRMYDNRIVKLQKLEAQRDELEEMIESIKEEIKSEMGELESVETGKFIIRYTFVTSNRFDGKAFKKDNEALYIAYTKPMESRRFTYKAK